MKKLLMVMILCAALAWSVPAGAVTFNLSTLNRTGSSTSTYYWTDPASGTNIIKYNTGAEVNPWTLGTGGGAATIEFLSSFGQGNNSSKLYVGSGGPNAFPLPGTDSVPASTGTPTTVGSFNSLYTGAYATTTSGQPFYFLFVTPGATPAPGPATLNSLYLYNQGPATTLEIVGLNGPANTGGTPIPGYAQAVPIGQGAFQQVVLNWTGVTEVYILGAAPDSYFGYSVANNFYVNDIVVNDPVPSVPEPATLLLLGFGMVGLAGLRRFRK